MIQPDVLAKMQMSEHTGFRRRGNSVVSNVTNSAATNPLVETGDGWSYTVPSTPVVKPQKAKVEIEELDSELSVGVRLKPLDHKSTLERIPSWPQVSYTHIADNHWLDDKKSTFVLTMESLVKVDDKIKPAKLWLPFMCQDVDSVNLNEAFLPKYNGKKYKKITQKFTIALSEPEQSKAHVPYVQFYCNSQWVRHTGVNFAKNDIITVVMKSSKYPLHWPTPPIVTVIPTEEQHIVPLLSKQKMVIITKKDEYNVEFKGAANSEVSYDATIEAEFDRQCHYFHCKKPTKSSEVIKLNHIKNKKRESKRIIVPAVEKEVRYPVILNPKYNSVIHTQNIDGFIIRFTREAYHPLVVMSGTPVRNVFTNENALHIERRYEIDKRRPYIYLEKHDFSWIIR